MVTIGLTTLILAALFVAAWLVAAVWSAVHFLRRARRGREAEAEAATLRAMIAGAPALPSLVSRRGELRADRRLADWLGLDRLPALAADLPVAGLSNHLTETLRAGASFVLPVHLAGSERVIVVHGRPAGAAAPGSALLWWFDGTDAQREIERLEAEGERLAQAMEAIAALIEAAPFPMWHRGPDLRLMLVNTAYVDAVEGEDATDVVTRGLELAEGEGGRGPLAAAARAREDGQVSVRTAPATLGGQRRTIRIVDVPLGESGVAGYAIDVEELEEARADLGRFTRAQRDMFDRLSAGVAQFGADRALIFSNQPFQRLFALQPDWLTDSPEFDRVLDRMREANRAPESRDFPRWKAERRAWFTAPEAVEETWLLPGGVHLRVLAQPLPDGGVLAIFEDRTEQVQLASARDTLLRVRNATFEKLFEAVGVFAADGRLHHWNSRFREVWGLKEADLSVHPRVDALVDLVGPRLANPTRAGVIRDLVRIATVDRQQRSGRVALADGRHFEFAAVPLPDGNALFTMLDISASRRAEAALRDRADALEEADKLKTAFVARMSYELRVPLTSIGGFAEMLAAGYAGALPATALDYVGAITTSAARLGAIVEDLLDLTQSEAGSLPLEAALVDLAAVAREAGAAAGAAAAEKELDLVVTIDDTVGALTGDARRLRQAIDHLLRNAIAYTPRHGRVLLHASGDEGRAEIVVSDDGPGIDPQEQGRVFDRFHRARREDSGGAGLGLGLPLTRQLVEAHGGTVTLLSEPGQGTAVIIRLPRRP